MQHLVAVAASLVVPTISGKEAAQLIIRWFHFIVGITWIGLLYFFNLINVPFMKQVDAASKPKIFQNLTLPALNWFRWSALATVFFWLVVLGTISRRARRPATRARPRQHVRPVLSALDRGLGNSIFP